MHYYGPQSIYTRLILGEREGETDAVECADAVIGGGQTWPTLQKMALMRGEVALMKGQTLLELVADS